MHIPAPNDKQFELAPVGTHLAVCYRIVDLGTQNVTWQGQMKRQHKILITWELPDEKMEDGRPFSIGQTYTWSMSEKATLRHHLESWRGQPFTDKDFGIGGFDIKNILGKACLLSVIHSEGEKKYANIASISRLMKGQQAPDSAVNKPVYLWLTEGRWDVSVFAGLPDWIKGKIVQSPEYTELMNGHDRGETSDSTAFAEEEIPF
jgi:hypothetical protein